MSDSGKAGNGRGNNRRRPFRRRGGDHVQDAVSGGKTGGSGKDDTSRRNVTAAEDRKNTGKASALVSENQRKSGKKWQDDHQGRRSRGGQGGDNPRGETAPERPRWTPPKLNTDPIPVPDCLYCGKPIRELASAMTDKDSGAPVHFDCAAQRIAGVERLERGDAITYIGGGRFGVVNFGVFGEGAKIPVGHSSKSQAADDFRGRTGGCGFKIKKIIEWENKDERAEWRSGVSDHYSVT